MDPDAASRLARALAAEADVAFAYLFGSQATGRAGPRSDVDVAVHVRGDPPPERVLHLLAVASEALRRDDVDLVVLERAPPELAFEALRGRLLFAKDGGERVAVEARLMGRYHDWEPHLRRQLAAEARRLRERGLA